MQRTSFTALLLSLLMLLSFASADGLTLEQTTDGLRYDFTLQEEFALLNYKTPQESGQLVLYGNAGQFAGTLQLDCSDAGGRAEVTVSTLKQKKKLSARLDLAAALDYAAPQGTARAAVKNLTLRETAAGFAYSFIAPGADYMLLNYRSRQEAGTIPVYPTDDTGLFEGEVTLPHTYARTLITVKVLTGNGSAKAEEKVRKGYAAPPSPEKNTAGRLAGVTVCIDPGHQEQTQAFTEPLGPGLKGNATGVIGMAQGKATQRKEAIVVLEIAMQLRDELLRQGADVVMTREAQEPFHTNMERCQIAADAGADVMLRLHCDLRQDANKRGMSLYAPLHSTYAQAVASPDEYRAMGDKLMNAMKRAVGFEESEKTGRVNLSDKFVGNNWAQMPCFLIEMGYMSNLEEDYLLSAPVYQQRLAEGMAQGIYEIALMRGLIQGE